MSQVIGNDSTGHNDYKPGLVRHDLQTVGLSKSSNSSPDRAIRPGLHSTTESSSARCGHSSGVAEQR